MVEARRPKSRVVSDETHLVMWCRGKHKQNNSIRRDQQAIKAGESAALQAIGPHPGAPGSSLRYDSGPYQLTADDPTFIRYWLFAPDTSGSRELAILNSPRARWS